MAAVQAALPPAADFSPQPAKEMHMFLCIVFCHVYTRKTIKKQL